MLDYLKAFIMRCSTSSRGKRVSSAMVWKVIVRLSAFRRKTDSMRAIKQIFCRKKAYACDKMGSLGNSGARASNFPILPSLKVNKSFFIHSCCVPSKASRIGCMSYEMRGTEYKALNFIYSERTNQFSKIIDRVA